MTTDVLVIGSGIAGLSFAIKMASAKPESLVLVLTKTNPELCNTAYAQGGIAVVLDTLRDSFEQHIEDTMKAGGGLSDPEVVKMVVSQAPDRLQELLEWGTSFDVTASGEFDLGLEGGHSQKRIVHHRDLTGREMELKLLQKAESLPNLKFHDHFFVTDLLLKGSPSDRSCVGVLTLDKIRGTHTSIHSKVTFLATGGSGRIFKNTTNPVVATADGVAMASRAGAKVTNMNFIQFHPTALYAEGQHALFLISEAVRGFGAQVVNQEGQRFLFKYDPRGELATRDIVSEAIVKELRATGEEKVYLDCRNLEASAFQKHFPTITRHCASLGIDVRQDLIPIVPAAHYQCGGIEVDTFARTTIRNLFASGECTNTGLHGANRLASNSLLEALVYSHQAAELVRSELDSIPQPEIGREKALPVLELQDDPALLVRFREELNETMTYDLLHASEEAEKQKALTDLQQLAEKIGAYQHSGSPEYYELRNMIETAVLILEQALAYSLQVANKTMRELPYGQA